MKRITLLIIFSLLFTGCATVYNSATQRKEIVFIDTKNEVSLGKEMTKQVKQQYKLNTNPAFLERVNSIGKKIAQNSDRRDLEYNFFVITEPQINAFALPGGYIYVNTGLLEIATDDELALVLGHEIGHIAARHPVKKLEATLGYQIVVGLLSDADLKKITNLGFNLIGLGYSRQDERLADKLSIRYAYMASFKPEAMISLLKKMQKESLKQGRNQGLIFLSSHPPISERIKNAEEELLVLKSQKEPKNEQNLSGQAKETNKPPAPTTPTMSSNLTNKLVEKPQNKKGFCPVCKKTYPANYSYCSQDGTKLN